MTSQSASQRSRVYSLAVATDQGSGTAGLDPGRYSDAQRRTAAVAFELFADHGVSGTSLQMIADGLGVTKAAVYHQFRTKEEIVLAVAEIELVGLQEALSEAEALAESDLPAAAQDAARARGRGRGSTTTLGGGTSG